MHDNFAETLDQQLGGYAAMVRRRANERPPHDESPSASWARFAAATGATLASVTAADAAITHVVPPAPIRVDIPLEGTADFTPFNLVGSPANDAQLGAIVSHDTYFQGFRYVGSLQGLNGLAFVPDPANQNAIRKLAANDAIPAVELQAIANLVRSSVSTFYYAAPEEYANGNWDRADTGLAGFVFGPSGQKSAGWIEIRTVAEFNGVATRMIGMEVLQWAYETVPGTSILAGQTSSGAIPGDYNNNGSVGPEDYTVWKNTFNNNVTAGTGADGNSNGKVDAADYTVWRDHQTVFGSAAAAAVPEPTTVSLGVLALGAAGVAALRRRASQ